MRKLVVSAALGAAALLGGVAQAQEPQPANADSMNCVYNALFEDYELVAEAFLFEDLAEADVKQALALVEAAKKDCATKFKLTEGQVMSIGEIGVYASTVDYLYDELSFAGVSEDTILGLFDVYDGLSDADIETIFDPEWRSNVDFFNQVKGKLVAAGIPDNADAIDVSMAILELSAFTEEASYLFLLDGVASDAPAN